MAGGTSSAQRTARAVCVALVTDATLLVGRLAGRWRSSRATDARWCRDRDTECRTRAYASTHNQWT